MQGIAVEPSGALTKILPRQAAGENSGGFTNEQSPQGGAFSRDLLDQKSKSPLFSGRGGGGGGEGGPWL